MVTKKQLLTKINEVSSKLASLELTQNDMLHALIKEMHDLHRAIIKVSGKSDLLNPPTHQQTLDKVIIKERGGVQAPEGKLMRRSKNKDINEGDRKTISLIIPEVIYHKLKNLYAGKNMATILRTLLNPIPQSFIAPNTISIKPYIVYDFFTYESKIQVSSYISSKHLQQIDEIAHAVNMNRSLTLSYLIFNDESENCKKVHEALFEVKAKFQKEGKIKK